MNCGVGIEHFLAINQFIKDTTQSPNVALVAELAIADEFRGTITWSRP